MTRSTSSTVRRCGIPVMGHGTSSVRNVTFWSSTFSVSRTRFAPGSDFTANRRNGMLFVVAVVDCWWFVADVEDWWWRFGSSSWLQWWELNLDDFFRVWFVQYKGAMEFYVGRYISLFTLFTRNLAKQNAL